MLRTSVCIAIIALISASSTPAKTPVDGLDAEHRNGQTFLTWKEHELDPSLRLNVYVHTQPITSANLAQAERVGRFVRVGSARDWTRDPSIFEKGDPKGEPVGFVIETGGKPLDPTGGLFVHTVTKKSAGPRYYAVTVLDPKSGKETSGVEPGRNSLTRPIAQTVGAVEPIWRGAAKPPVARPGMPLLMVLHSRRGGRKQDYYDHVVFGDATLGWREGLAHMFKVVVTEDMVQIYPSDRVLLRPDRAFNTFWYGYHSRFYSPAAMREGGTVVNYTERRLLWIIDWAQRVLKTDPERTYCFGGSMGGCGSVSMALHHPERFAAISAHVPVVSYTPSGPGSKRGSLWRVAQLAGPKQGEAMTNDGVTLVERMDGVAAVKRAKRLPFMYLVNGRNDTSIPWYNNPPFYKALQAGPHGVAAFWDEGQHGTCGRNAPADVKAWRRDWELLLRFRRNESYPVFTNCSTDGNPGNGDPTDGDPVAWINRGMDWKDVVDRKDRYAVTIGAAYEGVKHPVTVDVTPCNVQQFVLKAGETASVAVDGKPKGKVTADARGQVTVKGLTLPSAEGIRLELRR